MYLFRMPLALLAAASLVACQHEPTDLGDLSASAVSNSRHLVVTPDHLALTIGGTAQLTAQVFSSGNNLIKNARVAFASADPGVATVSATGLVTALAPGATTITVSSKRAADVAVPVTVGATHPVGTIAATVHATGRLFGAAVNKHGVVYLTEPDFFRLERIELPAAAFSGTVAVGNQATDVSFDTSGAFAYVTNQFDGNVGVVASGSSMQGLTIPLGFAPFRVVASVDAHSAFVSGTAPVIAVVDRLTGTTVATIPLPDLSNGLALNSSGTRLYASTLFSGMVLEIDATSYAALRTFPIPGSGTLQAVAVSGDDAELYVADEGTGQLWIIDLGSGSVSGSVALGGGAFEAKVSPDNAQVYVALPGSGVVRVIDRAARTVVATIATGGVPRRLAFTADGTTAVIANESGWVDIIH